MIASLVSALTLLAAPLTPAPPPLTWKEAPLVVTGATITAIESGGGALWAVGGQRESEKDWDRPVAARMVNGIWERTAQPRALGMLNDVAVRAADDVWAVGSYGDPEDPLQGGPLVQHWDGQSWREIPFPRQADAHLGSIAVHGDDVWVLGYESVADRFQTFALRYNGKSWIDLTDSELRAPAHPWQVEVIAPDDAWAALDRAGIKHYDGNRWTKAELPGPEGAHINDLAVVGPADIWAIGHREDPLLWRVPVAYHYDGRRWSQVRTPHETGQPLAIEVVDGKPVAVGETREGGYVLRWTRSGLVSEPPPPEPYGLYGSTVHDGRFIGLGFQQGKIPGVFDSYIGSAGPGL